MDADSNSADDYMTPRRSRDHTTTFIDILAACFFRSEGTRVIVFVGNRERVNDIAKMSDYIDYTFAADVVCHQDNEKPPTQGQHVYLTMYDQVPHIQDIIPMYSYAIFDDCGKASQSLVSSIWNVLPLGTIAFGISFSQEENTRWRTTLSSNPITIQHLSKLSEILPSTNVIDR